MAEDPSPPPQTVARAEQATGADAERPVTNHGREPPRTVWAYAYQIVPPQTKTQLRAVRAFLDQEHLAARNGTGRWGGRLILGAQTTRIMIVSDSLERSRDVNQRLESELKQLHVEFTVTEPVELPDDSVPPAP